MLKDFKGDKNKLGNAEKFLLALIVVPHYKLRLEGMIAKEDFKSTVDMLNEKTDVLLNATEGIYMDIWTQPKPPSSLFYQRKMKNIIDRPVYAFSSRHPK